MKILLYVYPMIQCIMTKIKNVNIDYFYIKEKQEDRILSKIHISTIDQYVDVFTKGLPIKVFSKLIS